MLTPLHSKQLVCEQITFGRADVETQGLKTTDALQYAKLDRPFWNSVVHREIRKDLPLVEPGRKGRIFTVDDLVALEVFAELLRIGVVLHVAGHVADDLRSVLRASRKLETVHLVTVTDADGVTWPKIVKKAPPNSTTLWIIHVAKAREMARATIEKYRGAD